MQPSSPATPLVSIGLPIYNGESYVDVAIRTALDQSFEDFELILADNASKDGTAEICASWAAADKRVRWVRTEAHTGAAANFNRAFSLSRGTYFRWASHDDLTAPTYLERTVERLRGDKDIVLVHSDMVEIDEQGDTIRDLGWAMADSDSPNRIKRFAGAIDLSHGCYDVFGLVRRTALAKTGLIAPYLGSDRVLLAELALQGRIERVPEKLFMSREHPERSIRMRSDEARNRWFASGQQVARFRPNWRRLKAVQAAVSRADISVGDKLRCRIEIMKWASQQRGSLYRELLGRTRPGDINEKLPPKEPAGSSMAEAAATAGPELS